MELLPKLINNLTYTYFQLDRTDIWWVHTNALNHSVDYSENKSKFRKVYISSRTCFLQVHTPSVLYKAPLIFGDQQYNFDYNLYL
jgi:hypothetical protein